MAYGLFIQAMNREGLKEEFVQKMKKEERYFTKFLSCCGFLDKNQEYNRLYDDIFNKKQDSTFKVENKNVAMEKDIDENDFLFESFLEDPVVLDKFLTKCGNKKLPQKTINIVEKCKKNQQEKQKLIDEAKKEEEKKKIIPKNNNQKNFLDKRLDEITNEKNREQNKKEIAELDKRLKEIANEEKDREQNKIEEIANEEKNREQNKKEIAKLDKRLKEIANEEKDREQNKIEELEKKLNIIQQPMANQLLDQPKIEDKKVEENPQGKI